jgi:hypothetical protein
MGGKLQLYRGLSMVFTKTIAVCGLLVLRHRFGVNFITLASLFWSGLWGGLLLLVSQKSPLAFTALAIYLVAMLAAGIWHVIEARRNLWNSTPDTARHSQDWGSSLLWLPFARLIVALRLENSFIGKMNEFQFQKWIEPLGLIILGFLAAVIGAPTLGMLFFFAGLGIFRIALQMERQYYRLKQQMIDAGQYTEIMDEAQQTPRPMASKVVTRVKSR